MKAAIKAISAIAMVSAIATAFLIKSNYDVVGTAVLTASAIPQQDSKPQITEEKIVLPEDLSDRQIKVLTLAYEIAKEDGLKEPEKFQGLVLQESRAGDLKSYKVAGQEFGRNVEKYFGVAQVKLKTALHVLDKYPELWKFMQTREAEEVVANLILNDEFCLRIASKYVKMLGNGQTNDKVMASYNRGPEGVKSVDLATFKYPKSVTQFAKSKTVRELNRIIEKKGSNYLLAMNEFN